MARASLALLFVLLLAATAVQALSTALATVERPEVVPTSPLAAEREPGPALPLRFGSACADIVNRSDRLLRPTRRTDDIVRVGGEGPCVVF